MPKKKHISFERNLKHPRNGKHQPKKSQEEDSSTGLSKMSLRTVFAVLCLAVASCFCYKGYLETRVNTPFDSKKVVLKNGLDVPERYWGTYRSANYFGLKTREPYSPVMGLMWYFPKFLRPGGEGIRHWCEQGDKLEHYSWEEHDGVNFGVQYIDDGLFSLTTSFVKRLGGRNGGDWTARISVEPRVMIPPLSDDLAVGETVCFIFYTAIENQTRGRVSPSHTGPLTSIVGDSQELGPFGLRFYNLSGEIRYQSYLSIEAKGLDLLKMTVLSTLRIVATKGNKDRHIVLPGDMTNYKDEKGEANFVAVQIEAKVPFAFDVVYESGSFIDRPNTLTGDVFTKELWKKEEEFERKFQLTYKLQDKGFNESYMTMAKSALSNLIGGIGYFYGSSRVMSEHTTAPVPYWKASLYTAVPSRSFFPRGFLWDEGFHGLIISTWDLDIELDIISHWFDLMNVEGWIPREQILGVEALAKVPEEFVTQTNSNANPPTFFLTLRFIIKNYGDKLTEGDRLGALERLYPRLVAWFDWFNSTQVGTIPGSYRWRGRDAQTDLELNPKTLTSGLDDYPRASHPSDEERHLDLRCWIALGAHILADIAKLLNRDHAKYLETYTYLSDTKLLDALHWSGESGRYADYGLHTDDVALKKPPPAQTKQPEERPMKRVVLTDPRLRLVDSTFGYVSLFPLMVHSLPPDSPKLKRILTDLRDPQLLWTDYGLRSLAKKSPLYNKKNTEHDPPYWRGPIWVNLNYLTLEALRHYATIPGPYKDQAATLYTELRANLISNIHYQYYKTGYIWEQYNDKTGAGQGSHPFTGWSSLSLLIMAEIY